MSLDVDMMRRLYEFGTLMAYRADYIDPLTFEVRSDRITFNENRAKEQAAAHKTHGFAVQIKVLCIHFDGAFAEHTQP